MATPIEMDAVCGQVENPIAFAGKLTRMLSMPHLHAQYAGLMLFPVHMSADWSYRCVRLVESLRDPRNLASIATYLWLVYIVLVGRPWRVVMEALYGPMVRAIPTSLPILLVLITMPPILRTLKMAVMPSMGVCVPLRSLCLLVLVCQCCLFSYKGLYIGAGCDG